MKMKKLYFFLLISLVLPYGVQAQQSNDVSFLKSPYRTFKNDLNLIKKCYLSRSHACSDNERTQAHWALARVTGEALGLIALLVGGGFLVKHKLGTNEIEDSFFNKVEKYTGGRFIATSLKNDEFSGILSEDAQYRFDVEEIDDLFKNFNIKKVTIEYSNSDPKRQAFTKPQVFTRSGSGRWMKNPK
jgi:hypothetical protein